MSETIDVNSAFDPQARQAQNEFDAYLATRPHSLVDNDVAMNPDNNLLQHQDDIFDGRRDAHEQESMGPAYEDMSVSELAKKLGEAEINEDKTTASSIEDVLTDKLAVMGNTMAEKSGKQSTEDRALAQDQLFDRVMAIKDNHKADLTGGASTGENSPADEAKKGPRLPNLDDVRKAAIQERDKAVAESNEDEIKKLNEFIGSDKDFVRPTTFEGLNETQMRLLLEVGLQNVQNALNEGDNDAFYAALANVENLRNWAANNSMDIEPSEDFMNSLPTAEQPAVEKAEDEPTEEEKVGRLKRGWRNIRNRVGLVAKGDYANGLARTEREEDDNEKNKTRRNVMIGAAAAVAAGVVVVVAAKHISHEVANNLGDVIGAKAQAKANKINQNADQLQYKMRVAEQWLKGVKAVEDFSGVAPTDPNFLKDHMDPAVELAQKLKDAKS